MLPAIKLGLILGLFFIVFCLVRLRESLHIAVYVLFLLYCFSAIAIMIPGALLMSLVYNIAIEFHENMHENVAHDDLVTAKQLRSIPVVKCTIGEFYHMEGVWRKN